MAPTDAKPVTSWPDRDAALYDVARKIERMVTDLQQHRRRDAELAQHEGEVGRKREPDAKQQQRELLREREQEEAQQTAEAEIARVPKPTPHSEESKRRRVKPIAALAFIAALGPAIVFISFLHKPSTLEPQRPAETAGEEERAPVVVPAPAPAPVEPTTEQPQLHPPATAPEKRTVHPRRLSRRGRVRLNPGTRSGTVRRARRWWWSPLASS